MSQDDFEIVELWADLRSQLTQVSQVLGGATGLPKVVPKHPSGASVKRLFDTAETAEHNLGVMPWSAKMHRFKKRLVEHQLADDCTI